MPERAVCYWLCDACYAETLAVSLSQLRGHWQGEIVLCYCPLHCATIEAARRLARLYECRRISIPPLAMRRRRHYVTKATLWRYVPFSQCVFLDADTAPIKPIEPLFSAQLTVTAFANWTTSGQRVQGRLAAAARALEGAGAGGWSLPDRTWPAINTGVLGWSEACRGDLAEWERLTIAGHRAPFTDELMLQLLLPSIDQAGRLRVVDDRWNCSPTYGVHRSDAAVWHFHGRRHIRKPEGQRIWEPLAKAALAASPVLAEWWGEFDPAVADINGS